MTNKRLFILYFLSILLIIGCAEKHGNVTQKEPKVTVRDVVLKPEYEGKEVLVEGKILTQCLSTGCWFILQDQTGKMMVDLKFLNLGLPPRVGKKVLVSGIVARQEGGRVIISARGLIIS